MKPPRQLQQVFFAATLVAGSTLGADGQVNTFTTFDQRSPSVSAEANGDFVVVWHSYGSVGTDDSFYSVQGQRYASDGSTLGGQFQVNTYTPSIQSRALVSVDADGDFVVVWNSYGSAGTDTSNFSIQGQRYASDGSTLGGEFQVNTYTTSPQLGSSVAAAPDGDFVVVWQSGGSPGTDALGYSIQGQRFASDGSTLGSQFQVNSYTTNDQLYPSVSVDADGDFVVVWHSNGSAGTDALGFSIQGQRYASDGSTLGGEFQVNSYTTNDQRASSVSADAGGDFVVVWQSDGSGDTDSSSLSVQGQRYASDGTPIDAEFQVNTITPNDQYSPSVSADADGDFVVAWNSTGMTGTDTSGSSIQAQRFASDGSSIDAEFQVNTYTTGSQIPDSRSISLDADGDFVVVWESEGSGGTDTSGNSIQKSDPGLVVPVELFAFSIE